jgi:hypothetical protein
MRTEPNLDYAITTQTSIHTARNGLDFRKLRHPSILDLSFLSPALRGIIPEKRILE